MAALSVFVRVLFGWLSCLSDTFPSLRGTGAGRSMSEYNSVEYLKSRWPSLDMFVLALFCLPLLSPPVA